MTFNQTEYMRKYRQENKDKIRNAMKKYYLKNRERFTEYNKNYAKFKYDNDEEYRTYMVEKSKDIYHKKVNPYYAECKRFLKMLL